MVMSFPPSRDGENLTSSSATAVGAASALFPSAAAAAPTDFASASISPAASSSDPVNNNDNHLPLAQQQQQQPHQASGQDSTKDLFDFDEAKKSASPGIKPVGLNAAPGVKKPTTFQRVDATKKFLSMNNSSSSIKSGSVTTAGGAAIEPEKPRNAIGSGTAKLVMMKGYSAGGVLSAPGGSVWNKNRPLSAVSTPGTASGQPSTPTLPNGSSITPGSHGPGLSPSPRMASAFHAPSAYRNRPESGPPVAFSGPTPMESRPIDTRAKDLKMRSEPKENTHDPAADQLRADPSGSRSGAAASSQELDPAGPQSGRKTSFCWADEVEEEEEAGMGLAMMGAKLPDLRALREVRDIHQAAQQEPAAKLPERGDEYREQQGFDHEKVPPPQERIATSASGPLAGNGVRMGWRVLEREKGPDVGLGMNRDSHRDNHRENYQNNYQVQNNPRDRDRYPGPGYDRERMQRYPGGAQPPPSHGGQYVRKSDHVTILHRDQDLYRPVHGPPDHHPGMGPVIASPAPSARSLGHIRHTSRTSVSSFSQNQAMFHHQPPGSSHSHDQAEPGGEDAYQASRKKMLAAAAEAKERRKREEAEEEAARLRRCAEKIAQLGLAAPPPEQLSGPAAEGEPCEEQGAGQAEAKEKMEATASDVPASQPSTTPAEETAYPGPGDKNAAEGVKGLGDTPTQGRDKATSSAADGSKEWDWRRKRAAPMHLLRRNESLQDEPSSSDKTDRGPETVVSAESRPAFSTSATPPRAAPSVNPNAVASTTSMAAPNRTPTLLASVKPFVPAAVPRPDDSKQPISREREVPDTPIRQAPGVLSATPQASFPGGGSQILSAPSQIQIQTPNRQGQVQPPQNQAPQIPFPRQPGPVSAGPGGLSSGGPVSGSGQGPVPTSASTPMPPFPTTPVSSNVWGPPSATANRILGNGTFGILHFGEHGQVTVNHSSGAGTAASNLGAGQTGSDVVQMPGIGIIHPLGQGMMNGPNGMGNSISNAISGPAGVHGSHGHTPNHPHSNHGQMGIGIANPIAVGMTGGVNMGANQIGMGGMGGMSSMVGGMGNNIGMGPVPNQVAAQVAIPSGPRAVHHTQTSQFPPHPQHPSHQPPLPQTYTIPGPQVHPHQGGPGSHQQQPQGLQHHHLQHLQHQNQHPAQAHPQHHLAGHTTPLAHQPSSGPSQFPYCPTNPVVPHPQTHGSNVSAAPSQMSGSVVAAPPPPPPVLTWSGSNNAQPNPSSLPDRTAIAVTRSGSVSLSIAPTEFAVSRNVSRDGEGGRPGAVSKAGKERVVGISAGPPAEQLSHFLFDEFGWIVPGGSRGNKANPVVCGDRAGDEKGFVDADSLFYTSIPTTDHRHPVFCTEARVRIRRPQSQLNVPSDSKKEVTQREKDGWQARFDSLLRGRSNHQSNISTSTFGTGPVSTAVVAATGPPPGPDDKTRPKPPVTCSISSPVDSVFDPPVFGSKPVVRVCGPALQNGRSLHASRFATGPASALRYDYRSHGRVDASIGSGPIRPAPAAFAAPRAATPRVWSVPPGDQGLAVPASHNFRAAQTVGMAQPSPGAGVVMVRVPGKKGMVVRRSRAKGTEINACHTPATVSFAPGNNDNNSMTKGPSPIQPSHANQITPAGAQSVVQPAGPPAPYIKPTFASVAGGKVSPGSPMVFSSASVPGPRLTPTQQLPRPQPQPSSGPVNQGPSPSLLKDPKNSPGGGGNQIGVSGDVRAKGGRSDIVHVQKGNADAKPWLAGADSKGQKQEQHQKDAVPRTKHEEPQSGKTGKDAAAQAKVPTGPAGMNLGFNGTAGAGGDNASGSDSVAGSAAASLPGQAHHPSRRRDREKDLHDRNQAPAHQKGGQNQRQDRSTGHTHAQSHSHTQVPNGPRTEHRPGNTHSKGVNGGDARDVGVRGGGAVRSGGAAASSTSVGSSTAPQSCPPKSLSRTATGTNTASSADSASAPADVVSGSSGQRATQPGGSPPGLAPDTTASVPSATSASDVGKGNNNAASSSQNPPHAPRGMRGRGGRGVGGRGLGRSHHPHSLHPAHGSGQKQGAGAGAGGKPSGRERPNPGLASGSAQGAPDGPPGGSTTTKGNGGRAGNAPSNSTAPGSGASKANALDAVPANSKHVGARSGQKAERETKDRADGGATGGGANGASKGHHRPGQNQENKAGKKGSSESAAVSVGAT